MSMSMSMPTKPLPPPTASEHEMPDLELLSVPRSIYATRDPEVNAAKPASSSHHEITSATQSHQTQQTGEDGLEDQTANGSATNEQAPITRDVMLKLLSAGFSFFFAGANDGSLGPLIPYMLRTYKIGTGFIAIIYIAAFIGWLIAAVTNTHLLRYLGFGAILALGAALQLLAHVLRFWNPPFALFAVTYFVQALGMAYQDSHSNTFVTTVRAAHRWLGFIHASYAGGLLVSPFVATAIASSSPTKWTIFFTFLIGLGVVNLLAVVYSFRDSLRPPPRQQSTDGSNVSRGKDAVVDIKDTLKSRDVWLISIFFFFFLGAGITAGGWVVEFLVDVRKGDLSEVGYVPAGLNGGMLLGRLLLAEPTFRLGERRMLMIYCVLMLALQLVFWLVPNLGASIAAISMFGFFFGPLFATGISVGSKLFPKRIQPTALGFVFVLAQAGGSLFPAITGIIASQSGVKVMQPIVVGLTAATLVSWWLVPKPKRRDE